MSENILQKSVNLLRRYFLRQTPVIGESAPNVDGSSPTSDIEQSLQMAQETILQGGLFDKHHYNYQLDEPLSLAPAIRHYLLEGATRGLNPNPFFDTKFYQDTYLDRQKSGLNPLLHYLQDGWRAGNKTGFFFDSGFYLRQYPDIAKLEVNPLLHFINWGARERRKTSEALDSLFDCDFYAAQLEGMSCGNLLEHYILVGASAGLKPNPFFDTKYYSEVYSEVVLSQLNPLAHYVQIGGAKGWRPHPRFDVEEYAKKYPECLQLDSTPLQHFLKHYDIQFYRQIYPGIDIELKPTSSGMLSTNPSLSDPREVLAANSRAGTAYFRLMDQITEPFSHVLVLPWMLQGGGDLVAANFVRLIQEEVGPTAPLVILTKSHSNPGLIWLPPDVKVIELSCFGLEFSEEEKVQTLTRFVLQMKPPIVHTINSDCGWMMYQAYSAQIKANKTKLVGTFFAYEVGPDGRKTGFIPRYLDKCIDGLFLLFSDNNTVLQEIADIYNLDESQKRKLIAVKSPSRFEIDHSSDRSAMTGANKTIVWASRLAPEKRPDILFEIAKKMPQYNFEIWGEVEENCIGVKELRQLTNVLFRGSFLSFEEVLGTRSNVFLYTSQSDGIPLVLLEAMSAGLAVIAPDVGGISEILKADSGWLIGDFKDIESYVAALLEATTNDAEREKRVEFAYQAIAECHSWQSFKSQVYSTEYLSVWPKQRSAYERIKRQS